MFLDGAEGGGAGLEEAGGDGGVEGEEGGAGLWSGMAPGLTAEYPGEGPFGF